MVFSILKSTNNGKRLFAGYYKYRGRCLSMTNGWIAYLPPKNGILLAAARRRGDGMKAFAGSKAQFLMSLTIKMRRRYAA